MTSRIVAALVAVTLIAFAPRHAFAHPMDEANIYHFFTCDFKGARLTVDYRMLVGGLSMFRIWDSIDTDHNKVISPAEKRVFTERIEGSLTATVDGAPLTLTLTRSEIPEYDAFIDGDEPYLRFIYAASLPELQPGDHVLTLTTAAYADLSGVYMKAQANGPNGWRLDPVQEDTRKGATVRFNVPTNSVTKPPSRTLGKAAVRAADLGGAVAVTDQPAPPPIVESSSLDNAIEEMMISAMRESNAVAPPKPNEVAQPPAPVVSTPTITPASTIERSTPILTRRPPPPRSRVLAALRPFLMGRGGILIALGLAVALGAAHALLPGHGKAVVGAYLVGTRGSVVDAVLLGGIVTVAHTGVVLLFGLLMWNMERFAPERVQPWLQIGSGAIIALLGLWMLSRGLLNWRATAPNGANEDERFANVPRGRRSRRGLISLGLAGGIVPCGDALILLLFAHAQGRTGFGLVLVAAFGLGMAVVLMAIGIAMTRAHRILGRFMGDRFERATRVMPLLSATAISILGCWITVDALIANGMLILRLR